MFINMKNKEDYESFFGETCYINEKQFAKIKNSSEITFLKYLVRFRGYEDSLSDLFYVFVPIFFFEHAENHFIEFDDRYELMEIIKPNVR